MLDLAPVSSIGIVISEDGTKQDNAVYTAVQQLVNGYIPHCLPRMFDYNLHSLKQDHPKSLPWITGTVPMIVTNAQLFRLKSSVSSLEMIREAKKPSDIADEVSWTGCYHEVPNALVIQNMEAIHGHERRIAKLLTKFPGIGERL